MLHRTEITDELRARVREELPEAAEIRDPELRAQVIEAWALALAASSFRAIAEIEPSGNPGVNTLRRGTQTDHIRGVTRLAIAIADELCAQLPDLKEVAHCAAAHSGEGELLVRSLENTIVHHADYAFWGIARAGDLLVPESIADLKIRP